jgi:hypothetical protein
MCLQRRLSLDFLAEASFVFAILLPGPLNMNLVTQHHKEECFMQRTVVVDKRRVTLTVLTIVAVMALGLAAYRLMVGSDLLPAFLGEPAARLLGGTAKPDTRIAEKLTTAEANGELYNSLEAYADLVTPELLRKLQVTAAQVLPQMQAVSFQSRLVSIEGTEIEKRGDGQYQVLVHGKVEVQGEGIPPQVREGTATVIMDKVDGRWLVTDYRSLGGER